MSGIDFRPARGPAALFVHDEASRRRAALDAARAIVHAARLPPPDRHAPDHHAIVHAARLHRDPENGGAPAVRPVRSPQPGRAGRSRARIDALIAGTAILALLAAGFLLASQRPGAGGLWL